MNVRYLSVLLMLAVLVVAGGILPASSAAQTVVGPEYALVKSPINSLQRGERQCDYFLWTKLGGDVQRVSFSYISQDGKSETEAPQIEDLAVVINPACRWRYTTPVSRVWAASLSLKARDTHRASIVSGARQLPRLSMLENLINTR